MILLGTMLAMIVAYGCQEFVLSQIVNETPSSTSTIDGRIITLDCTKLLDWIG